MAETLDSWLRFLRIEDCPCSYEWQALGRLYGISMGSGWVRITTDPTCRHHGENAIEDRRA